MSTDFERELSALKEGILKMGTLVEAQIENSIKCLVETDLSLAEQTIKNDHLVNVMDVEIDEECIRLLSLCHPMASDLRFITTAMKIHTDLERMGDLAVEICKQSIELSREPLLKPYIDIPRMSEVVKTMVRQALDAFVRRDAALAGKVLADDAFIDETCDLISSELVSYMVEDSATIIRATQIGFVSKYIERIGNHAANMAGAVVYLVEGKNIRHTKVETN